MTLAKRSMIPERFNKALTLYMKHKIIYNSFMNILEICLTSSKSIALTYIKKKKDPRKNPKTPLLLPTSISFSYVHNVTQFLSII